MRKKKSIWNDYFDGQDVRPSFIGKIKDRLNFDFNDMPVQRKAAFLRLLALGVIALLIVNIFTILRDIR